MNIQNLVCKNKGKGRQKKIYYHFSPLRMSEADIPIEISVFLIIFVYIIRYIMEIYKPEIAELLSLVEDKYTKSLRTTTDFDEFSFELKKSLGRSISTSTLKRLWGYVSDAHAPRIGTLDILSQYLGYNNFTAFSKWLKTSVVYNSSFFSTDQILTSTLQVGRTVEIGWSPNRVVRLTYCGENRFEVTDAVHSKLKVGDQFEASCFQIGQPLVLPYILRDGMKTPPFIAGRNGGLTNVHTA